jgi:uncharacterized protein YodC (DUF2158 family)
LKTNRKGSGTVLSKWQQAACKWCNQIAYFEYSGFEEDALIMQVTERLELSSNI